MSARNILFLYNKVNSLLSPWHTNQSHCFMASSFQAKTLAATRSIYVPLTCPNSASFSLMSLLPRRDSCAVWAIKQRELSHFLFITTDCYLSSQPTLSPSIHPGWKPPHFSVLPLQWLCFTDFLLGWWAQKHILQTNKYTNTVQRQTHRLHTHTHTRRHGDVHKHWQSAARAQSVLCSHTGHCNVTHRVSFCHPQINNGKILIKIFNCSPRKRFLPACYITRSIYTGALCQIYLFIFRQYWFMLVHC